MRRALAPFVVPLLALSLLAGCGGGEPETPTSSAPPLGDLLADTAIATKTQHSASYALDGEVSVEGSSSNPALQLIASQPIQLRLDGGASATAFSASGTVSALGKKYSGEVLADEQGLYLNLQGNWYGSRELGIDTLKRLLRARLSASPGTSQLRTVQQLREHAGEILTGSVSDGPTLDGARTWEFDGHLNAVGIAALSRESGQPLTAQQRETLETLQKNVEVTIDIGKDDDLLRRFDLAIELTSAELERLSSASSSSLSGLSAIHLSLTLDLSKWGEAVSITPPSSYKPLAGLTQGLFGLVQS